MSLGDQFMKILVDGFGQLLVSVFEAGLQLLVDGVAAPLLERVFALFFGGAAA